MQLSPRGLALIQSFEGYRANAYRDSNGLWACGYGHTTDVCEGDSCTPEQAAAWLAADVGWAERAVTAHALLPLKQNQFDALVSFTYNVGEAAFADSTLLRMVNMQNWDAAAAQFLNWDHIGGIEIAGLERRREAEAALFEETAWHVGSLGKAAD